MIRETYIQHCQRIAERLGGKLEFVSEEAYEVLRQDPFVSDCPFSDGLAVNYEKKTVYVWLDGLADDEVGSILHELGHVLASPDEPHVSNELPFMGWEYSLAKSFKGEAAWFLSCQYYVIDAEGTEFRELTPSRRRAFLEERLEEAKKRGLIKRGRAVSIRS